MRHIVLTALAVVFLTTSPALAAVVSVVKGQVSVNRGDGYQPVIGKTGAWPADRVMASPNSSGEIVYEDGCVVEVKPGAVVAVQERSPCNTGRFGIRPGYLIVGALVVGGVAGGLALLAGGDDNDKSGVDKPASP
jgi:hypothetical protein